jgi:arylsulfatase A-like enzyme
MRALCLGLACAAAVALSQPPAPSDRLVAIFVVDGLRPDSINAEDTPTIDRLRLEGVEYLNSHSVFPTSTRVNAATLVTGTSPARHGIVGNSMFVAGVNPQAPFDTGDHTQLLRLEEADGRVLTTPTLGEVLQRHGRRLVTVSSGTTGNGFVLNPQARHGAGIAIHGLFEPGKTAAYPRDISDVVIKRFGSPPPDPDDLGQMEWTDTVLREYVLPDLRPDVVIDWMGPLDSAQHAKGVGSPEAKQALRAIDRSLARTLAAMRAVAPASKLDVVITSDHGFAHHASGVNIVEALVAAGVKASGASTDVVVASQGQSALFYVPSHDVRLIARLVDFLQRQPWAGVIFTRGSPGQKNIPGTFPFDPLGGSHASRSPDVAVSLAWSGDRNAYGVPGAQTINSSRTGPLSGGASGHGGLSPWVVHNTLVLWGDSFGQRARMTAPASLADVMPTVLTLLGVDSGTCAMGCGRVLQEALRGSQTRQPAVTRRTLTAAAGPYRASLRISSVNGRDYVDEGARAQPR